MARRREAYNPLLKSYPDSDSVNAVSEGAEVLYVRLIAASDDAGRYYGSPDWILAKLFTARMASKQITSPDIEKRVTELESVGLLRRYAAKGATYIELIDCFKCLRKDVTPQIVYPEPVAETGPDAARPRNGDGTLEPEPDPEPNSCCAASAEVPSTATAAAIPIVELTEFVFPTTGKNPKDWTLTAAKLAEYVDAYPALDVPTELRKARQWCRDKARNRKTYSGMPGFLTGWLNRCQNKGGGKETAEAGYQKVSRTEFLELVKQQKFKDGPLRSSTDAKWVYGTLRDGSKVECRDYYPPKVQT